MTAAAILVLAKEVGAKALAFISKPPGSYIALAILAVLALWLTYGRGYDAGKTACEARHAAAAKTEIQRQQTAAVGVVARTDARTNQNATADVKAKEIVTDVTQKAKAQPDSAAVCISADVADRLRGIE
jgi:hypothetical protein